MICTSSYINFNSDICTTFSISGNRGKDVNYQGKYYSKLAPKVSFWRIWHENIGKISEEENNRYYVQEYWDKVLSQLDPKEVYDELNNSILLCYEPNNEFCHRHIVAAWFEILLGVKVSEVKAENYVVEEVEKPEYIKEYLEDAMKFNRDMRGFKSFRALYLFEKGIKFELKADELERKTKQCCDDYRKVAYFFKFEAAMIEKEYALNQKSEFCKK